MNIIDTLIRLRDDLKEWVSNNIIEVKSTIPNTEGLASEDFVKNEINKLEITELQSRISRLETIIENGEYLPPIDQ